jgi:beta-glucosidase
VEREPAYKNPNNGIDERVTDLLGRMTLSEKLAQLSSVWAHEILDHSAFDEARATRRIGNGIGQITRLAGGTNLDQRSVAALANGIQRFLVEKTRLGIPAMIHEECLHGLLARESVCFPQSIGQAATWEPGLVEKMAGYLGRELRSAGAHQGLAPVVDITRDPRWGRVEETYGEDPYLAAAMGVAYIRGLQGNAGLRDGGLRDGVIATAKHLGGHGLPEGGLNHAPIHVGARELQDTFLFPFEAAVREAQLGSVMHAYDEVDGVPCVASRALLTEVLRERWDFDGLVVSDYSGIDELMTSHAMTSDRATAAALALEAGVDVELPTTVFYDAPLADAVASGRLPMAAVDLATARVLRAKFALGLFEHPYVEPEAAALHLERDSVLAREIARRSMTLLANDGTLPLSPSPRTVAVIGPNADSARNLLGDYAYHVHVEAMFQFASLGWKVPEGVTPADADVASETILGALRRRFDAGTEVRYAQGCGVGDGSPEMIEEAVAAATGADVAVVVVGDRSGLTPDCTTGEFRDRLSLGLLGRQSELVAAVAGTGTPVVLVVVSGRPLAIEAEARLASAVVYAWVPGQEGPEALVDVLLGVADPGGRLPITVARHVGQIPIYYNHKPSGGRSQIHGSYVDGSNLPLWPFGFGMSYTKFEISNLRLDRPEVTVDGEFTASVEVRNVGQRAGDEVVQLYVRDVEASVTRPVLQLCGFKRVTLEPGEVRTISFRMAAEQLAFTSVDGRLRVEPGRIAVMAGSSSQDLPCTVEVEIIGEVMTVERRTRFFTEVEVE